MANQQGWEYQASPKLEAPMFWVFIILIVAAIIGGSIVAGRMIEKRDNAHRTEHAHGQDKGGEKKLSRRDKLNLARVAGVVPTHLQKDD